MQIRHDTSLLERAIDLQVKRQAIPMLEAEAAAHDKIARANGFRRMASGVGVAIAAVGIGIGVWLIFGSVREPEQSDQIARPPTDTLAPETPEQPPTVPPKREDRIVEEGKSVRPPSRPDDSRHTPAPPEEQAGPPNPVTEDFTKFLHYTVSLYGKTWTLTSGHHYPTENSESWDTAWCYSRLLVDGIDLNLDLANRLSPTAKPQAPVSPPATFASVGWNDAQARDLATKCQWLDKAYFSAGDFVSAPDRQKAPALTIRDGWDALGYDLPDMPVRNISLMECRRNCEADSRCQALTYNSTHSACFMKSGATILVRNEEATMAAKDSVASALVESSLVFAKNTVLVGNPYTSVITGYADCIMACALDQRCAGFNHDANKLCTMLDMIVSSSDFGGVASGVKATSH